MGGFRSHHPALDLLQAPNRLMPRQEETLPTPQQRDHEQPKARTSSIAQTHWLHDQQQHRAGRLRDLQALSQGTSPHLGLAQQRSRHAQQLALPGGEVVAALRDSRLQAQRQRRNILLQDKETNLIKVSVKRTCRPSGGTQKHSHQALSATGAGTADPAADCQSASLHRRTHITFSAHLERDVSKRLPQLVICVAVVGVQVGAHSAAEKDGVLRDGCNRAGRKGSAGLWQEVVL